jgi:hypothetical protein
MKTFTQLLQIGLGAVLAYAGAVKALDPAAFATSLGHYQLFPGWLLAPLATGLPWLELVVGAALVANRFVAGAARWSCGLSAGFAVALGTAWARGLNLDCGCFGGGAESGSHPGPAFARAVVLLGTSVFVVVRTRPAAKPAA